MFANSVIVEKRSCLSEIAPDVILQIFLNKMIVWSDIVESKKSLRFYDIGPYDHFVQKNDRMVRYRRI